MNTLMHGRAIKKIFFLDDEILEEKDDLRLELSATYHGDHDEFWVVAKRGTDEVERWNCKSLAGIVWK